MQKIGPPPNSNRLECGKYASAHTKKVPENGPDVYYFEKERTQNRVRITDPVFLQRVARTQMSGHLVASPVLIFHPLNAFC
jgi:hypothetical protein